MQQLKPKVRATVVCIRDDRVLLVSKDGVRWALPGGRPGKQESPEETARRELQQETSLETKALVGVFQFIGATTVHHVFTAAIASSARPKAGHEIKSLQWLSHHKLGDIETSTTTRQIVSQFFSKVQRSS
ncbi:NUDIX hydrolase [Cupriavidus sp. WKF15]|uniref:NUDIX hydrolase n=1 Tax=Cupriavidus sp. WKF15 TaxID=3032282 RepID=UPI0023E159A8|nr:NUDIX hydrolase [Cupriavidus sp. WKF15]WER48659.1 NUDIX hydrolase [Cupriavidus sp. WKF15]